MTSIYRHETPWIGNCGEGGHGERRSVTLLSPGTHSSRWRVRMPWEEHQLQTARTMTPCGAAAYPFEQGSEKCNGSLFAGSWRSLVLAFAAVTTASVRDLTLLASCAEVRAYICRCPSASWAYNAESLASLAVATSLAVASISCSPRFRSCSALWMSALKLRSFVPGPPSGKVMNWPRSGLHRGELIHWILCSGYFCEKGLTAAAEVEQALSCELHCPKKLCDIGVSLLTPACRCLLSELLKHLSEACLPLQMDAVRWVPHYPLELGVQDSLHRMVPLPLPCARVCINDSSCLVTDAQQTSSSKSKNSSRLNWGRLILAMKSQSMTRSMMAEKGSGMPNGAP